MINLITGTPGSGKTYLAIKLLLDKHFYYHRKDRAFYRKKESKKYVIFTNINNLKLEHKNLDDIFKSQNLTFDLFFAKSYQDKLHKKYRHIIYIIDECQQYISTRYNNKDVILYFDTHRHYGDKVYLITQDYKKICTAINTLVELEYRAVKSTFSIVGEFRYNIKSNNEIFKRLTCRKDKKIFDLYQSFVGDDNEQHSNPLKYIIIVLIITFVVVGYYFYYRLNPANRDNDNNIADVNNTNLKNKYKSINLVDDKIVKKPDKSKDLSQIVAVEIESKVIKNDKLYAYECPLTQKWFFWHENPYNIKKVSNHYYILISQNQIKKVRDDYNFLYTSSPPRNQLPPI